MAYISYSNSKMKKTAKKHNAIIGAFGITPVRTCPGSDACQNGCFALQGRYNTPSVKAKLAERHALTLSDEFIPTIDAELKQAVKKARGKQVYIRIHDVGDFYSPEYIEKWFKIMALNPDVRFYAYTKSIHFFKVYTTMPANFRLIYSLGGKYDLEINTDSDAHARVFGTVDDLLKAGYTDCSADDLLVYTTDKVGLVYHGQKSFSKTGFKS